MAGLQLERKSGPGFKVVLLFFLGIVFVVGLGGLAAYWYNTGYTPLGLAVPATILQPSIDSKDVSGEQILQHKADDSKPRYVSIPALDIENVRVFAMGKGKLGDPAAPKNLYDASWFDESAEPGQEYGTVTLTGYGDGVMDGGVFSGASKLKSGDVIAIERGDGTIVEYEVVENNTESVAKANQSGLKRLFTPYDETKEGLGLIVVTGSWIPKDNLYDTRTLIRAVAKVD